MPRKSTATSYTLILLAWLWLLQPFSGHAVDDFTLEDLQGRTHRLADYRGKWVLVNFWATWCPPCLEEIPELSSLHATHKDSDLVVIGIAMDSGSRTKVADFALAHHINYPVVLGSRKLAAQIGPVEVLPVSYLYRPTGERAGVLTGRVTQNGIERYLKDSK